ncbi:MAG: bile acid:sodium symporter [Chloroflexota bacterium]
MTMIQILSNVLILVFVVTSMFELGLGLTIREIMIPMKRVGLVTKVIIANFVVAPLGAFAIARVMQVDQQFAIGLFILGVAAGSPFAAKFSKIAKGDMAFVTGMMAILQLGTIVFAPFLLTLMLENIEINTVSMVRTLVMTMFAPLALGLFIRARYDEIASIMRPYITQISSVALILQIVLTIFTGGGELLSLVTTGAIVAAVLFTLLNLAVGYYFSETQHDIRVVAGLVTAQRGISAALIIAAQNFSAPRVIVMVIVGAALMLIINFFVSGELGKHQAVNHNATPAV